MTPHKVVLSASRRTELLHYPDRFIEKLDLYPPERVHTIVLWTKTPYLLFQPSNNPLLTRLLEYDHIYMHITITGLGSSFLEPHTSPYIDTIDLMPRLIDVVGSPTRINVRFDPILNLIHETGATLSNLGLFPTIVEGCKEQGVTDFTISWMAAYTKVKRRLSNLGFVKFEADDTLKRKQAEKLNHWAKSLGININGCCTQPNFPGYGCINGRRLSELHPKKAQCTLETPSGQRALCVCTLSRDIGWYLSCPNGCAYCYGQPKFELDKSLTLMETWTSQGVRL